jgi:20S proteasome alpha/beta subunit
MTLCLAIRHAEGILLGVDSATVDGYGPRAERVRKIYTSATGAMVGCGSVQEIQKFGEYWEKQGTRALLHWLRISPAEDWSALIVEGRTLRSVSEDGSVGYPRQKYTALGSGQDLALGYLTAAYQCGGLPTLPDPGTAEKVARGCFRACARFDHQVRGPFKVVTI